MLDGSTVADVAQDGMWESSLQLVGSGTEEFPLVLREGIEVLAIGTYEMREHGAWDEGLLGMEALNELRKVLGRLEAETVHTRVELQVDGEVGDTLALSGMDEGFEESEAVDLRLKVVLKERLERRHLRIHHHDIGCDACTPQLDTFVGNGHSNLPARVPVPQPVSSQSIFCVPIAFTRSIIWLWYSR